MSKLPPLKRFSLEDFQDQKDWIDKLISPLNEFMNSVSGSLENNLNHAENLLAQVGTITVQTTNDWVAGETVTVAASPVDLPPYAELSDVGRLRVNMKAKPLGLVIWRCIEIATNPSILRYAVTADWSYSNGLVTINHVSGLEPAKKYQLTVALYGG